MTLPSAVTAQVEKAKTAKKTSEAPKPNQAEAAAAEVRAASAARTVVKNESDAFKAAAEDTESKKAALNKELDEANNANAIADAQDDLNDAKDNEFEVLEEETSKYPISNETAVLQSVLKKPREEINVDQRKSILEGLKKQLAPSKTMNNLLGSLENDLVEEDLVDDGKKAEESSTLKDTLVNSLTKKLMSKSKHEEHNSAFLYWDSPDFKLGGRVEDIIAQHIQPKMKFAYMGEFPGELETLNWLVKSMDKPKIDIESVEQIRNNVKRNYPIKYNYGDLSITFWDDMDHKTVLTLSNYFTNNIWQHTGVSLRGRITLRDSIIVPKFSIYELTTNTSINGHLKYTFENCILSSFDFDNSEDESDDGVHTVQAVFKIERYEVETKQSPIVLNPENKPKWL